MTVTVKAGEQHNLKLIGKVTVHSVREDLPGVYFRKTRYGRLFFALEEDWHTMLITP